MQGLFDDLTQYGANAEEIEAAMRSTGWTPPEAPALVAQEIGDLSKRAVNRSGGDEVALKGLLEDVQKLNEETGRVEEGTPEAAEYDQKVGELINNSGVQTTVTDDGKNYALNVGAQTSTYRPTGGATQPGEWRTPDSSFQVGDAIKAAVPAIAGGLLGGAVLGPVLGNIGTAVSGSAGFGGGTLANTVNTIGGALQAAGGAVGGTIGGVGGATQGELGESLGLLSASAAANTPYGGGVSGILAGEPPDDYEDTDFGDLSSIIDNTRGVIQIPGLPPLPTYGMKIEDIRNLPGDTIDWIRDVATGATNPIDDIAGAIQDAVGGTADGALQTAQNILAGVQGAWDILQNEGNVITNIDPVNENPTPQSPVTGAPEETANPEPTQVVNEAIAEVSETPASSGVIRNGMSSDGGQITSLENPSGGSDGMITGSSGVVRNGMNSQGGQITSVENPDPEPQAVTGVATSSGGGGGGGGGQGDFDPFMASVSFDFPLENLVDLNDTTYLAKLFGESI